MNYEQISQNKISRHPQILVVEDDPAIQELLKVILTKVDHWVISSVDCGAKAVSAWSSGDFDVIVMDLGLPYMDGITAAKKIRKMELSGNMTKTPIIALTAQSDSVKECMEAGMDEFVSKPFSTSKLIEKLEKYLNGIE